MNRSRSAALALVVFAGALAPSAALAQSTQSFEIRQSLRAGRAHVPEQLLVQFRADVDDASQTQLLGRINAQRVEALVRRSNRQDRKGDLILIKIPRGQSVADAMTVLETDSRVEFAEPNWVYTKQQVANPNDQLNFNLWGMMGSTTSPSNAFGSGALAAWNAGKKCDPAVHIGVIDEGIMTSHTDLRANIWVNAGDSSVDGIDNDGNRYIDDTNGWDFAGRNRTVYDGTSDDHGTHVAGTIAATANNATGVWGVCPTAKLISAKFLGSTGGTTADAILAVDYITNLKTSKTLRIVATNNSWGGGGFSKGLYDAISRANSADILFIAAAGNDSLNIDATASFPAAYGNPPTTYGVAPLPNVIAVAAIASTGALATFSNYGATTVHLGAPGVGIYSTVPGRKNASSYASYNGTSMATPHVAGAAALYASLNPCAKAAQIKSAILSNAVPTASLTAKTITGGRLDVSKFQNETTCGN